jgi:hypothetical protein
MMKRSLLLAAACLFPLTVLAADLEFRYVPIVDVGKQSPRRDATALTVLNAAPARDYVAFGRLEIMKGSANASDEQLLSFAKAKAAEMGAEWILVPARSGVSASGLQKGPSGRTASAALVATIGAYPAAGLGVEYLPPMMTGGKRIVSKAKGGLESGDEIIAVNGVNPDDRNKNAALLLSLRRGDTADVTVRRAEKVMNLKIPLVAND